MLPNEQKNSIKQAKMSPKKYLQFKTDVKKRRRKKVFKKLTSFCRPTGGAGRFSQLCPGRRAVCCTNVATIPILSAAIYLGLVVQ